MLDELIGPFTLPFMQRALAEVALLSVAGGLLASWIVLRRLAFYTHAAGGATFPGLVVAEAWGVPPRLAGLGTSLLFAGALERLTRRRSVAADAGTGLLLVAALALGVVLASDVYRSGVGVDRLLFGSLLAIEAGDLVLAAVAAGVVVALNAALLRPWLASAFDPSTACSLGLPARAADRTLLVLVAAVVVVSVDAAGALLVGALFVLPAATVLLVAPSVRSLQAGSVALTLVEGAGALWLSYRLDVPPGPALALLGGLAFGLAAALAGLAARRRDDHPANGGA